MNENEKTKFRFFWSEAKKNEYICPCTMEQPKGN